MQSQFFGIRQLKAPQYILNDEQTMEKLRLKLDNSVLQKALDLVCSTLAIKTMATGSLGDQMKQHPDLCYLILLYLDSTATMDEPGITDNLRQTVGRYGLFKNEEVLEEQMTPLAAHVRSIISS